MVLFSREFVVIIDGKSSIGSNVMIS